MFRQMVKRWFGKCRPVHNAFLQALRMDDVKAMNVYMNMIALQTLSYLDTMNNPPDLERNILKQISRQNYETVLMTKGISRVHIRKYGFAFCGKRVLIGEWMCNNPMKAER